MKQKKNIIITPEEIRKTQISYKEPKKDTFYYCQLQIEQDKWCKTQCKHCKEYYKPLEEEKKMEDLKEWIENKDLPGINPQTFKIILNK